MRVAAVGILAIAVSVATSAASAQNSPTTALAAATPTPAATRAACPGNPDPLGVARTVEIDTTGGPGFGFEQFKAYDFLREGKLC